MLVEVGKEVFQTEKLEFDHTENTVKFFDADKDDTFVIDLRRVSRIHDYRKDQFIDIERKENVGVL